MSRRHRRKSWQRLLTHLPKIIAGLVGVSMLAGGVYFFTKKTPEDHFKAGIALQKSGDLKGAAIELKNLLQLQPGNGEARLQLGRIHFANGDFQAADKELKKALELGVNDPELLPLQARTLLILNQPQRVLDEINEKAQAAPEINAAILALRARAQLLLNNQAEAEKLLADADARFAGGAESLVSRAILALTQKKTEEALVFVDQALLKSAQRADLWVMKGDLLRLLKRNEEALAAYAKAKAIEPGNISAHLVSAQIHLESGALDKTEADLKALRKYAPNNVMGRYLEAYVDFRHSRFSEADAKLQDVFRATPNFLPAHLLGGAVKLALNNREAAKAHLEKVLAAAPQHPLARKLMAATLADLGDVALARKMLDSFGDAGNDPMLNSLQGELALRQGDFAQARKYLENAGGASQQSARHFTELAASRMGTGDESGAIEALRKAAELDTASAKPDILLVLAHLKEKRYDQAFKAVDKLETERPNDPLVENLRGTIYAAKDDKVQARANFSKALQINPAYFPAASNLALLDVMEKNSKAARGRFEALLKHAPEESRAWLALAALDAQEKDEAAYLKHLEQAKKANSKNVQPHLLLSRYWLGKREAGKALAAAREGLDATGRIEFQEFIGLAQLQQQDLTNALAAFSRWAEVSPTNPMAHFRLAQLQMLTKDNDGALKSLQKTTELRPEFVDAMMAKAILLGQMGRSPEAIKIARNLQTAHPKTAAGFLAEAEVLFNEKKYIDAGKLFAKASQISGQGEPLTRAFQAYVKAGQAAEGERLLQQWLKEHPSDAPLRHQLALVQLNENRQREAADNYQILVKANPKDFVAQNNLAWLLSELKAPNALAVAEQAYKLSPEDPGVQDTLGWILVNAGQTQRGLGLLKKAFAKAPQSLDIHWHLAAALAKAGDRGNALANLEILLGKDRDFTQKQEAIKLFNQLKQN